MAGVLRSGGKMCKTNWSQRRSGLRGAEEIRRDSSNKLGWEIEIA